MLNKNWILIGVVALGAAYFFWSRMPRYGTGTTIPDFEITNTAGNQVKLSDYRGKMVLVHFWGSWCGPCRQENPELSDLYARYHDKGLEIISVAVERSPQTWAKAIAQDGINWPNHVMEPGNFDGPLAKQFNVHSIPALFLINKQGQLMANNPSLAVLDKMLMEQLSTH